MRKITIEVTQHDIDHGFREDPENCPIARALMRRGEFSNVVVDGTLRLHGLDGVIERGELPTDVVEWIDIFDHRGSDHVGPGTFVVELK